MTRKTYGGFSIVNPPILQTAPAHGVSANRQWSTINTLVAPSRMQESAIAPSIGWKEKRDKRKTERDGKMDQVSENLYQVHLEAEVGGTWAKTLAGKGLSMSSSGQEKSLHSPDFT